MSISHQYLNKYLQISFRELIRGRTNSGRIRKSEKKKTKMLG